MARTPFQQSKRANTALHNDSQGKRKSYRARSQDAPTWDSCNPLRVAALVCLATTQGASPTFGYTRDGTSLVIAIWHRGERHVDYLSGPDDFAAYFEWAITDLLECDETTLEPYRLLATDRP